MSLANPGWGSPCIVGELRKLGVVLNDRHLKRTLTSYLNYYHCWRTHLSLGMNSPESRSVQPPELGKVVQFQEVGGLHHRYERVAPNSDSV
jgi:hypothetical protein